MIFVLTIDLKRVYTICTFRVLVAVQVEQHHPHGHQMPGCAGRCHDVAATIVLRVVGVTVFRTTAKKRCLLL